MDEDKNINPAGTAADANTDAETMAIAARKVRRKRRGVVRKVLLGVWLVLLLAFIYIAVQVVLVLTPSVRREIAILDTMTDSITARGFVALQSEVVLSDGSPLYFAVDSGERVSQGTAVAHIYASEAGVQARTELASVQSEIDRLEAAMNTSALSGDTQIYLKQMQAGLQDMLNVIDGGQYAELDASLGDVALASNKLQMATGNVQNFDTRLTGLNATRERLLQNTVAIGELAAPTTGYFVHASGKDRIPQDYDTLAAYSPAALQMALDTPGGYYASNVAGYIITDYKWHFFALVDAEDAARFTVGDKSLSLSFAELGTKQLPVRVESVEVDMATGLAKVELYCEYISPEILKMQNQTVEIVFRTEQGIRISREALRIYEGQTVVYVVSNNVAYKRAVNVLLEDDFYILLPQEKQSGVNEVSLYDTIIVDSGGTELYDGKPL